MNIMRTAALLFMLITSASSAYGQRYELSAESVAIYNLVGNIRIENGTGDGVVVEVQRRGPDAERLTVRHDAINGVPTLRIVYPEGDIIAAELEGNSRTTVQVNEDGTFNNGRAGRTVNITSGRGARAGIQAHVDLIVQVPAGVRLRAQQAVGKIAARAVAAELTLRTSAGPIETEGLRRALDARTASGNIKVRGAQADLGLRTASGSVDIDGARATSIKVNVASGSITVADAVADDIQLESASGNVRVVRTRTARLRASSASGGVRAELDREATDVQIRSASGSAVALLPADFSGEVELRSSSGNVDVDFPITITQQRRNQVRGTIGHGGSARIRLSSASGDVRLIRR